MSNVHQLKKIKGSITLCARWRLWIPGFVSMTSTWICPSQIVARITGKRNCCVLRIDSIWLYRINFTIPWGWITAGNYKTNMNFILMVLWYVNGTSMSSHCKALFNRPHMSSQLFLFHKTQCYCGHFCASGANGKWYDISEKKLKLF